MTSEKHPPLVCRDCGKVNRRGSTTCERCGGLLSSDTDVRRAARTATSRPRLVTRTADDGSLEMVRLSPDEADAAEEEEARERTGEHDAPEPAPSAAPGRRRQLTLLGAVAGAALLVVVLAWPRGERAEPDEEPSSSELPAGAAGDGPTGPRAPKLPPLPPPEPP